MTDLDRAKSTLRAGAYTCVLCRGEVSHSSSLRGVKPLVLWRERGTELSDFSAADKVVGKATAFLYVLHRVRAVYAAVISRGALAVLRENGITVEYGELVEHIINRAGDGTCPFEAAVAGAVDAGDAYSIILSKMAELGILER